MKRSLRLILILIAVVGISLGNAASLGVCAQETETMENKEEEILKVGYVADRKPVSFQDEKTGELAGISRKIFDRLQELSGLKFEYVALPQGAVTYDYLREQGFDLVTSVEYNAANLNARGILISQPYLSSKKVIIGSSDFTFDASKESKIAVSTGSQTLKKVLSEQYPHFEIVDYETNEECFDAVKRKEADLLIQNQYVAEYCLLKPEYQDLEVIPVIGLADQLCFSAVVPIEDDGGAEWNDKRAVIDRLNAAIDAMTDDEVAGYVITATLENPYHYTMYDMLYSYRYQVLVLGIALLIICALTFVSIHFYLKTVSAKAETKVKDQFLSAMSHEMKTPLNGLIGLNYLMSQNLGHSEKLAEYLQQSESTARYLQALVNDILDVSKLRDNQIEIGRKPFSLWRLIMTVESLERGRMEEKGLSFEIRTEIGYPVLWGDEIRVQQVILNILSNAYKFTPPGGKILVRVSQQRRDDGRIATGVEISDTGCGMSEEFQKRIFDSFTQESGTVSKGNQGTGLGMAISYNLAKLMDGSLNVESQLGKGSKFTFVFTAESVDEEHPEEHEKEDAKESRKKQKVLIAEDNELNAQILQELLEEEGFEVTVAVNGRIAADRFAASAPGEYSYILMDLLMPVMDGFESAKEIRRMDRPDAGTVKIIACTANSSKEDWDRTFKSGMNDFLTKPIDMEQLFAVLHA